MFSSSRLRPAVSRQKVLVSNPESKSNSLFHVVASSLGISLLVYLVLRSGPQTIWRQLQVVGLGLALIIVLGGISHFLKTWAWRLTFTCDVKGLSWGRS